MDRNLGANRVATDIDDAEAYGGLYQWDRGTDGYENEKWNSSTTPNLSSDVNLDYANFITINSGQYDWKSLQNNSLWEGVDGINNPCPTGFCLPTETELVAEIAIWSPQDKTGVFNSALKLPAAGRRGYRDGSLLDEGSVSAYWPLCGRWQPRPVYECQFRQKK